MEILTIILQLLLLSTPWIEEVMLDLKDAKNGIWDNHKKDIWTLRAPAFLLASLVNVAIFPNEFIFPVHLLQSLVACFGLFVMFFDMTFGTFFKKDPFYLGESSSTDNFLKRFSKLTLLGIRIIILGWCLGIYFGLDRILQ